MNSLQRQPRAVNPAPPILLFADAGAAIGGGHVMRCLTLADALRARGATCAFAATPAAAAILDVFADQALPRFALADADPPAQAAALAGFVAQWGAAGLVVDHYGFGPTEEAAARVGARLLALDDLRREHACDLVLDSGLDRIAADYPGVEALTGPRFALVRPAFAALRDAAMARRSAKAPVRRLLVALGLTDVGAISGRVVEAVLPVLGAASVDVVLGQGAASLPGLAALASVEPRVKLHVDTRGMAELTAAADLAIGAGGSSVWERCCLGLPTLLVVLAENQRDAARALAAAGAAEALDASEVDFVAKLQNAFRRLAGDASLLDRMSAAAGGLCDGLGADRVAERFLGIFCDRAPSRRPISAHPGIRRE